MVAVSLVEIAAVLDMKNAVPTQGLHHCHIQLSPACGIYGWDEVGARKVMFHRGFTRVT